LKEDKDHKVANLVSGIRAQSFEVYYTDEDYDPLDPGLKAYDLRRADKMPMTMLDRRGIVLSSRDPTIFPFVSEFFNVVYDEVPDTGDNRLKRVEEWKYLPETDRPYPAKIVAIPENSSLMNWIPRHQNVIYQSDPVAANVLKQSFAGYIVTHAPFGADFVAEFDGETENADLLTADLMQSGMTKDQARRYALTFRDEKFNYRQVLDDPILLTKEGRPASLGKILLTDAPNASDMIYSADGSVTDLEQSAIDSGVKLVKSIEDIEKFVNRVTTVGDEIRSRMKEEGAVNDSFGTVNSVIVKRIVMNKHVYDNRYWQRLQHYISTLEKDPVFEGGQGLTNNKRPLRSLNG
jgi:hypothetical protein